MKLSDEQKAMLAITGLGALGGVIGGCIVVAALVVMWAPAIVRVLS
jgi:hypothetical protein